jgi:chemotaxis response regulator CheB
MPGHDIIVIGASSGGIEALVAIVSALPAESRLGPAGDEMKKETGSRRWI